MSTNETKRRPPLIYRHALFAVALLLLAASMVGQEVAVTGQVTSPSGEALPGVDISITLADGKQFTTFTAADGTFRLQVPPGEYRITATLPGFSSVTRTIRVMPAQASRLRLILGATAAESSKNYAVMKVFYATDRALTGEPDVNKYFGAGRGKLRYGAAFVSIPRAHQRGHLESPRIWKLEFREDPDKHIVLQRITHATSGRFYADIAATVKKSEDADAFVFIHGYNVSFADAARRTAQLAYDLTFRGAPILYSWPSHANTAQYIADKGNAEWTVPHLESFLRDLARQSGARTIHLVAHSMGNAALVSALDRIARGQAPSRQLFKHIALTAPDIDAQTLEELAGRIRRLTRGLTIYVSRDDVALKAAESIYQHPRAGQSIMVLPDIDTVDASGIDTTFFGHSPAVTTVLGLTDLRELLLNDLPPPRRGLREAFLAGSGRRYWVLQP